MGFSAPGSFRRGGGDLHPLAHCRASLLAAQESSLAPWGPPQFAHLPSRVGTDDPFPLGTPLPGTGARS